MNRHTGRSAARKTVYALGAAAAGSAAALGISMAVGHFGTDKAPEVSATAPAVEHISAGDLGPKVAEDLTAKFSRSGAGMVVTNSSCDDGITMTPGATARCQVTLGDGFTYTVEIAVRDDPQDGFATSVIGRAH